MTLTPEQRMALEQRTVVRGVDRLASRTGAAEASR